VNISDGSVNLDRLGKRPSAKKCREQPIGNCALLMEAALVHYFAEHVFFALAADLAVKAAKVLFQKIAARARGAAGP